MQTVGRVYKQKLSRILARVLGNRANASSKSGSDVRELEPSFITTSTHTTAYLVKYTHSGTYTAGISEFITLRENTMLLLRWRRVRAAQLEQSIAVHNRMILGFAKEIV